MLPLATVQLQSTEAPSKAAPAEPELAAHLSSLLPVRLCDSTLSVLGHDFISGLTTRAFGSPDVRAQEQQGVVLGLAGDSSVALRDFNLGQVGCRQCHHKRHPQLVLVPERGKVSLHPVLQLKCRRFLSSARIKLWWQTPEWGCRAKDVQPETQFMLLELSEGGPYAVLLPLICHNTFRATLRPPKWGQGRDTLTLRLESGAEDVTASRWEHALYVAAGVNPYQLVDAAVATAAALSGGSKPRALKEQPATLDLFGWCTWDAFYFAVSAKGIQQGLQSFKDRGVPPRTLIIDDGWQLTEVDEEWQAHDKQAHRVRPMAAQLAAVSGRPGSTATAPGGDDLKSVVANLRREFDLDFVYCWHALHAYWCGVSPDAPGTQAYASKLVYPKPTPGALSNYRSLATPPATCSGILFHLLLVCPGLHVSALCTSDVAEAGVAGVKVDVQASVGLMGSNCRGGPDLTYKYHTSLEDSIQKHFPGNHCINCMCHSTENLYRMRETAVARVSDDFYPTDSASWTSHIPICSYNSLFMGALIQPDWDMFHSKHPAALLHATARAISGGAVYVSDKPGHHDFSLLRRLVLLDGSVLRARLPGRATRDILFDDPMRDGRTLLKVWNMNAVNGVLGVFNAQGATWSRRQRRFVTHDKLPSTLQTIARPRDIDTFYVQHAATASTNGGAAAAGRHFAMYSDRSGALQLLSAQGGVQVALPAAECDILVVAPVQQLGSTAFAAVGLVNMLNAGGAVLSCRLQLPSNGSSCGPQATAEIWGAGELLALSSRRPVSLRLNGREVQFDWEAASQALRVAVPEAPQLRTTVTVSF
eukprot:jgi/Astpho2/5278/e_gw1.00074.14.1_t